MAIKLNFFIYLAVKFIAEVDKYPNTGPHEVPNVLSRCQYGAINGTTHIEMIFSF
jgi:hypothetical protein